jgi:hypothetical protein
MRPPSPPPPPQIDPALIAAFSAARARAGAPVDYFTLKVDPTAGVTLVGSGAGGDDGSALWLVLEAQASGLMAAAAAAAPAAPAAGGGAPRAAPAARPETRVWVVRAPPTAPGDAALADAWLLVGFTPEGAHPRDKMVAAAARDDVRRVLGAEHFVVGDYFCAEPAALTAAAFREWRRRDASEAMSARELAARDVDRAVAAERASAAAPRGMGMALAPAAAYALDADVRAALPALAARGGGAGWLELRLGGAAGAAAGAAAPSPGGAAPAATTLTLAASGAERGAADLAARAAAGADEPRFFLTRPDVGAPADADADAPPPLLLIYHCPEGAKPRARMAYSTAKPALVKALAAEGVAVAKTVRGVGGACSAARGASSRAQSLDKS